MRASYKVVLLALWCMVLAPLQREAFVNGDYPQLLVYATSEAMPQYWAQGLTDLTVLRQHENGDVLFAISHFKNGSMAAPLDDEEYYFNETIVPTETVVLYYHAEANVFETKYVMDYVNLTGGEVYFNSTPTICSHYEEEEGLILLISVSFQGVVGIVYLDEDGEIMEDKYFSFTTEFRREDDGYEGGYMVSNYPVSLGDGYSKAIVVGSTAWVYFVILDENWKIIRSVKEEYAGGYLVRKVAGDLDGDGLDEVAILQWIIPTEANMSISMHLDIQYYHSTLFRSVKTENPIDFVYSIWSGSSTVDPLIILEDMDGDGGPEILFHSITWGQLHWWLLHFNATGHISGLGKPNLTSELTTEISEGMATFLPLRHFGSRKEAGRYPLLLTISQAENIVPSIVLLDTGFPTVSFDLAFSELDLDRASWTEDYLLAIPLKKNGPVDISVTLTLDTNLQLGYDFEIVEPSSSVFPLNLSFSAANDKEEQVLSLRLFHGRVSSSSSPSSASFARRQEESNGGDDTEVYLELKFEQVHGGSALPSKSKLRLNFVGETTSKDDDDESEEDKVGIIVGSVFGAVGFLLLVWAFVAALAFLLIKNKRKRKQAQQRELEDMSTTKDLGNYGETPFAPSSSSTTGQKTRNVGAGGTTKARMMSSFWTIAFDDLEFSKEIGSGAFGTVWKGKYRGADVAVKRVFRLGEQELADFHKEIELMQNLRPHPNVVQLIGVCTEADRICIVTEYLPQGSLLDFLRDPERNQVLHPQTTERGERKKMMIRMAKDIAAGMEHLRCEGITHRDLAARNLLLTQELSIKVADFGLARNRGEDESKQTASNVGPLRWMSPESMEQQTYSEKSDVWSYGVTLWEMATMGQTPYPDLATIEVAVRICKKSVTLEAPKDCPSLIAQLIEQCTQYAPKDRPTFAEIMSSLDGDDASDNSDDEKESEEEDD
ncbi:Tyrosine-protein kinase abl2 [Balamuthia mandrillaris]